MSTTTTRSAKLYSSLTPIQLARIAQGYLAKQDSAELRRIVDALPTYTYRGVSRDFLSAVSVPRDIAMVASVCYWQKSNKKNAAHGIALYMAASVMDSAPEKVEKIAERVSHEARELNAIIAAWQEICERMGWDIEALSQIAGIPIHPPPSEYDEATKAEHLEGWQSVLDTAGMAAFL